MAEKNLYDQIMLIASKMRKVVLFRNNTGMGWVGSVVHQTPTEIVLRNPRPLHAGLIKGSSDLIGWTLITIEPHHVGQQMAVFTAIEGKTARGTPSESQQNFIDRVCEAGGIAGVVKDESEIHALITQRENGKYSGHQKQGAD